ncbi:MAG: hypothetical protein ACYDCK_04495 [Thermoplasmatota archaeon]
MLLKFLASAAVAFSLLDPMAGATPDRGEHPEQPGCVGYACGVVLGPNCNGGPILVDAASPTAANWTIYATLVVNGDVWWTTQENFTSRNAIARQIPAPVVWTSGGWTLLVASLYVQVPDRSWIRVAFDGQGCIW